MAIRILPFLLYSSLSFAAFESGRYTVFDRYGLPPSPEKSDPLVAAYDRFELGAKKGGTLKVSDPDNIDLVWPGWFQKGLQKQALPWFDLIYETLMKPDVRGSLRTLYPWLAKAVRVDTPSQTYVIELNEDARFSDGSPMQAENVVFSTRFFEEEIMGPAMKPWLDRNLGKIEIKALSPLEVQVRFPDIAAANQREALYAFLAWTYMTKKNPASDPAIQIPYPVIGTGPYTVESANRERASLKRDPNYWNKSVPLFNFDRIETTIFRDRDVVREAFKRGDLNFFEEPNTQAEAIVDGELSKGRFRKHDVPIVDEQIVTIGLYMNTARPHLKDPRFRKAMILLADIPTANRLFYNGKLSVLNSPAGNSPYSPKGVPPPESLDVLSTDPLSSEAVKPFEDMGYEQLARIKDKRERTREALRLLREAGYEVSNSSLTKGGQPVELTVVIMKDSRVFKTISLFQSDLNRAGIKLNIVTPPDSAARVNAINSQNYDFWPGETYISREFENFDPDNVLQRYSSDNSRALHPKVNASNYANLNSPALDQVLRDLIAADRSAPSYGIHPGTFLRLISAHLPYILMGERITTTVYADKNICVPPTNTRILESIYFCP